MDTEKTEIEAADVEVAESESACRTCPADIDIEKALKTVAHTGEIMLVSGGEASRVEDTVRRILLNFGFMDAQVFVIPGMLIVTVECGENASRTVIKRISGGNTHLGKVSLINSLSRELATHNMSIDEFLKRLDKINNEPSYKNWITITAAGTGSFAFTYIINADILASFVALFVGALVYAVTTLLRHYNVSRVLVNVLVGLMGFVFSYFAIEMINKPGILVEVVVFGSIIPHLPGVSLVSSLRDIMDGDLVSGSIGLVDAVSVAGALAVGVLVGYSFMVV